MVKLKQTDNSWPVAVSALVVLNA